MESLELPPSNHRRLALPIVLVFALAAISLLLVTPPVQGNEVVTLASSYANQGTISLSSSPVITIGVGTYLSNPDPSGWDWGWVEANSVQLAISQTNAAGGINVGGITYTLILVSADDGCNLTQAIPAAYTLLNAGAVAVVGHGCSGASLAAQPLYNAAGVAMISPSSTNPQITQKGYATSFRTISHDGASPTLLATYFHSWLGLSKSAIVDGPARPWGDQLGDIYRDTFTTLGGTITSRREVANTTEFTTTLTAIMAENPDVIYYNDDDPTRAGQFSLSAYSLGMTTTVTGWSYRQDYYRALTDYPVVAGTAAAENDYLALQYRRFEDMLGWAAFLSAYQAASFSHEPNNPGDYGAFAYDAARMIIAAIDRADSTDPVVIRNQIAAMKNYDGVVGMYQGFDGCGDIVPQWAWLERYQGGQWIFLASSTLKSNCSIKIFLPLVLRGF